MKARVWPAGLVAAGLLLAGCGSAEAAAPGVPSHRDASAPITAKPAPGNSAVAGSMSGMPMPAAVPGSKPTATALMVCGDDIKGKVKKVLQLPGQPRTSSTFKNGIYTCTYQLPVGPLVLSVAHSPTKAAAGSHFAGLQATFGSTAALAGLGEKAFGTPGGIAVVLKDDETLVVDATALPAVFGSDQQKRTDLANEIASDVLGCWTGG